MSESNPLIAIPMVAADVQTRPDDRQQLHLRRQIPVTGWLARFTSTPRDIRFILDPMGAAYWELIDGHRTLGDIARALAERHERTFDQAAQAVMLYTRTLARRKLITLKAGAEVSALADA